MRTLPTRFGRGLSALLTAGLMALATAAGAVDGVVEINQAKAIVGGVTASDTAGFPVTIDAAGSYRLTSNLALVNNGQRGIEITASNVTIDLNGFEIGCDSCASAGGGAGVFAGASVTNITVRNGTIRSPGGPGVGLDATEHRVENMQILGALTHGIDVGPRSRVIGNTIENSSSLGITCDSSCDIQNNVVTNSGGVAIDSISGSRIRDNVAVDNTGDGIECTSHCTITGNVSEDNGGAGIDAGTSSLVAHNVANTNASGIDLGQGTAVDNVATGNTGLGLIGGANTGYGRNVLSFNNSNNDQASAAATEIGINICQGDTTCP